MGDFLKPRYEPKKTSGVLTPNQSAKRTTSVVNGMAAELELTHKTKLRMNAMLNTILILKKESISILMHQCR